jgi:hypothetical protein
VAVMTRKIIKTGALNFGSRFRVITIFAAPATFKISTWDPGRAQGSVQIVPDLKENRIIFTVED